MSHLPRLRRHLVTVSILILTPLIPTFAQTPMAELRARGVQAYNSLPARNVTLADANVFSAALANLFAYEQRLYRDGGRPDDNIAAALKWLIARIPNLKTSKADSWTDDNLRNRGMEMYQAAKASEKNGRIWAVAEYVSAVANLYAYSECTANPRDDAKDAYEWLKAMQAHLIQAGGAADAPNSAADVLLASGARPRLKPPRPSRMASDVSGSNLPAATSAGGLPRWVAGIAAATPPRDRAEPAPPPQPIDTSANVREENEKLKSELSTLRAENDRLRATIDDLHRRVETISKARDARQARALSLFEAGKLKDARDMARSALELDPSFGDAHMLIARIYANASAKGTTPEDGAVVWLAIDHATQAAKAGAGDHATMLDFLRMLEARTPTSEDLTRQGWTAGQRLRVSFPGYEWIDEETTIRARR